MPPRGVAFYKFAGLVSITRTAPGYCTSAVRAQILRKGIGFLVLAFSAQWLGMRPCSYAVKSITCPST